MKKSFLFKVLIMIIFCCFVSFFSVQAQNKELIPGQTVAEAENTDFIGYLNTLYNFSIAIAAILAVFMIALGSFSYIFTSAGNTSKMLDAKEMIKNAIIGLALVLVAFLILFIINPDLVKGTILAPSQVIQEINK